MAKKNVVFSTISIDHDIATADFRWKLWRPLVELVKVKKFFIHRLYYFIPPSLKNNLSTLQLDLEQAAPHTEIIPIVIEAKNNFSPQSFAKNYLFFDSFFSSFPFRHEEEEYFLHFGPGNMFAHSFMLMMLVNIKRIQCRIIQLRSSKDKFGRVHSSIQIYDNAINHWISKIGDIEQNKKSSREIISGSIGTKNPVFNRLVKDIEHVAIHSTAPILLSGATGTGKTEMARRIYELRLRNGSVSGPLVEVNCASFRGDSALSALFGHVRGAFTGASQERKGMLAMAHTGILFLDEVGELSLDIQALLLKAIEERRFFPFGSDSPVFSDFQLITATNRDLYAAVRRGEFRMDLISRINLWQFHLPSLRERPEDIEPNLDYELKRLSERRGIFADFLPEARAAYLNFACSPEALWPSNFRTLSGSIERMHTYSFQGIIGRETVDKEIAYLRSLWLRRTENLEGEEFPLCRRLEDFIARKLDLFDKVQLEKVLEVCLSCERRSEAGRILFAHSRLRKNSADDTARLNKYLHSYGLNWDMVKQLGRRQEQFWDTPVPAVPAEA